MIINDLPRVFTKSLVDIYADDTTLSASAPTTNPSVIQNHLQNNLNQVINWSVNNKMIINSSKTKALLVTGKRLESKLNLYPLNRTAHGNSINEIESGILLGVTIGVLKNIKKNLPIKERILFFNSMIKPIMLYGSPVWDSCSRENIQKISKLQKRAAGVILEADSRETSKSLSKQPSWLAISDEMEIKKCCLIYKRNNGLTPNYINDILVRNADTHSRLTRHCNINLVCPTILAEIMWTVSFLRTASHLPGADLRFNKPPPPHSPPQCCLK